jgi:hypothetical protein
MFEFILSAFLIAPFAFLFWPKQRTYRLSFDFGGVTLSRRVLLLGLFADTSTPKHEAIHQGQIRELGPAPIGEARFFLRWFRSPLWKLRYEAAGFAVDIDADVQAGYSVSERIGAYASNYRARYDDTLSAEEVTAEFWNAYNLYRAIS